MEEGSFQSSTNGSSPPQRSYSTNPRDSISSLGQSSQLEDDTIGLLKGKSNDHSMAPDIPLQSTGLPIHPIKQTSASSHPQSQRILQSRDITPSQAEAALILVYMSRGERFQEVATTIATATGASPSDQLQHQTSTHPYQSFVSASQSLQFSLPITSARGDDYNSSDTIDEPIDRNDGKQRRIAPTGLAGGARPVDEAQEIYEQDGGQGFQARGLERQAYVPTRSRSAAARRLIHLPVLGGVQLTILEINNHPAAASFAAKSQPNTEASVGSPAQTSRIRDLDREADEAIGFPGGIPQKEDREGTEKWLTDKVDYLAKNREERNRHWPKLMAGLELRRHMSKGFVPGSDILPPSKATRGLGRVPSKQQSSEKQLRPEAHADSDGEEPLLDSNFEKNVGPKGKKAATIKEGHSAPKVEMPNGDNNTNGHTKGQKRRRTDDLSTNLGPRWDAHVDPEGRRPKKRVQRNN
ncbi:hypothetical protein BJ170DRAFT_677794 [Xylariales sp. AK1849]|nr:hypothetical protein BJ170DRAFT_677794 [Xylariales sp. AK1849]